MGTQCGLCGHFNNEPIDEFRKPNFEIEDDVREYFTSWTLNEPSGCKMPEPKSVCTEGRCPYKPFSDSGNGRDPESNPWELVIQALLASVESVSEQELQEKPVKRTRMVEINGHVCFSVQPVDQCRRRTYAVQKEAQQIQFACYERDDEEAESLMTQIRTEDIITISRRANGIREMYVPSKCAPLT